MDPGRLKVNIVRMQPTAAKEGVAIELETPSQAREVEDISCLFLSVWRRARRFPKILIRDLQLERRT